MAAVGGIIEFTANTNRYSEEVRIKTITIYGTANFVCKLTNSVGATICNVGQAAAGTIVIPLGFDTTVDAINITTWTNVTSVVIYTA